MSKPKNIYSEKNPAFLSDKRKRALEALVEGQGMTIIEAAEFLDGLGTHSDPQAAHPRSGDNARHHGIAGHHATDPRRYR